MKYLFICSAVLFLMFGCGKKGPIELPTGYHDNTIQNAEKLDPPIVPVAIGTNITDFDPIMLHYLWMGFSKNREIRTLLKYNIASASDMDMATTTLSVKLKIDRLSISAPLVLHVYRLTKSWEQNKVTWGDSTTDTPWTTPGGDFTTDDSFTITVNPGDTEINITDAMIRPFVTHWKANSTENFGMIIVPDGATPTDMQFVAVYTASFGDSTKFPNFSYTVGDTTKTILPALQGHIANINEVNNNNPGVYIIGDGYHPMLTIGNELLRENPDWDILQAILTLNVDNVELINQLNLPSVSGKDKYFTIALGTTTADGFTNEFYFSIDHKVTTGKLHLDLTKVCKFLQYNTNYTSIIYLSSNRSMLRYLPFTLDGLDIYYRKPVGNN